MNTRNLFLLTVLACFTIVMSTAEQNNNARPSDEEIRLYLKNSLGEQDLIRVGRWIMKHGLDVMPLLLEVNKNSDHFLAGGNALYVIERNTTEDNAQKIIDRLLEEETTEAAKTTALEIAEKFGFKGEGYRSVLLEVLSTTEYGGLQKTLLELLRTYGREEDAELVMDVFKNSDNRDIKSVASDTLLAIGGPKIIEPWEKELARLRKAEPERQRKKREKEERMAKEIGVELPPRRPSKFIESIDDDLQSLKEKVATEEAGYSQGGNPKASLPGGDGEYDEDQASAIGGQSNDESKSARSWPSFPLVLAGMIALAALIVLARKRKA